MARWVNAQLSSAEQIKCWAVLAGQLTFNDGALSSSPKVRRVVMEERVQLLIDALYHGGPLPDVLYAGGIGPD